MKYSRIIQLIILVMAIFNPKALLYRFNVMHVFHFTFFFSHFNGTNKKNETELRFGTLKSDETKKRVERRELHNIFPCILNDTLVCVNCIDFLIVTCADR